MTKEPDFSKKDLRKSRFEGEDLQEATFYRANLENSNFYRANLARADFDESNLAYAVLSNADCTEANFNRANLDHADCTEANFREAYLLGVSLENANLINADFYDACLSQSCANLYIEVINWKNELRGDIIHSSLRGAIVTGADFREADMQGVDLRDVIGINEAYLKGMKVIDPEGRLWIVGKGLADEE